MSFTCTLPAVLLFISTVSYPQNKAGLFAGRFETTPPANNSLILRQQIDSIAGSNGKARPFAEVYKHSMENISLQMQTMDTAFQAFVIKFETAFARYFLDACFEHEKGQLPATSEWTCFFSGSNLPEWKRILLGVNTHVNIDIWAALVNSFPATIIKKNRKQFLSFQSSISKVYDRLFDTLLSRSGYMRFITAVTFHLDKKLGERILLKWRKRSVKLAILFYDHPERFKRKWEKVQRKKRNNDRIILRSGPKQKPE